MTQKAASVTAIVLVVLGVIGVAFYYGGLSVTPSLSAESERTIVLELEWGGDMHTSEELSCDVWAAAFNCELRRGGNMGMVISRTLPLVGPIAAADPPESGLVVSTTLTWDTSSLTVGPYETHCRLELDNGEEEIWGYIEGQGQDGQGFYLADKFSIGETCIVPRRFIATLQ